VNRDPHLPQAPPASAPLDLIATSTFGLEAVVKRELIRLGYDAEIPHDGRILFRGDESAIARANLWLRASDRVLVRIGEFDAEDFGVLFDGTRALPWHEWIPADGAFPVAGRSVQSQLSSVPACQKIVKKAIVEALRAAHGVTELPESGARYAVEVALLRNHVTLTLDTSGAGLHKRGYRTLRGEAPIKETLGAALVLLSNWRPDRPLIDPFCGTGTIPIEAALIGRNLAPGRDRHFAAEAWPRVPAAIWDEARAEARALARAEMPGFIMGTDVDGSALAAARQHAAQAGVAADIHFEERSFAELASRKQRGVVISNPPYGERIGDRAAVRALYASMPGVLRKLRTWSHYILTADRDFERIVGQSADRRRKLYNGPIQCTYYQFHGPDREATLPETPAQTARDTRRERVVPSGPPPEGEAERATTAPALAVQAFGGITPKMHEQARAFGDRLAKRARHLRRWPAQLGITCYRLYERDIPEIPLVVDRYADRLHISEYERPHDHTPGEHADWLELMARAAAEVLQVPWEHVFVKHRAPQRGVRQHERQSDQGHVFEVGEGGLRFLVNLSDYIDTGLFLDHRITRGMVRAEAAGKRVLNLFGYTGAFTVYAAAGGAAATTTVDLSPVYLEWAERNMALNGFAGPKHRFVESDATVFLERHPSQPAYDLVVVDPPTFTNSKKMESAWDVQRGHAALLNRVLELVTPGGIVFFSTNFRRFKLEAEAIQAGSIREITDQTIPPDFRNRRIHRAWRITSRAAESV
jgi:23S rRNA (guanine2445-N2)-methyltransferase / 23S rRNA (guanine2069-N7)-methyltransferase